MLHFWTDDKINISSVHIWKGSIDETNAEYFSSQTENVFCNMGYRNNVFINFYNFCFLDDKISFVIKVLNFKKSKSQIIMWTLR